MTRWRARAAMALMVAATGNAACGAESAGQPPALTAPAALPAPARFATGDGAYQVFLNEPFVDPYFVNKAFIIGMESGQELHEELQRWIDWLAPRQRADGGFDRFCRDGGAWHACQRADADDSMAATTMQMIEMARQRDWLTGERASQAQRISAATNRLLHSLHDAETGLYRVFADQSLYYLMDNAEVYDALVATDQQVLAQRLATALQAQFLQQGRWQPSIPAYDQEHFYPHRLAPVYLWTNGLIDEADAGAMLAAWLAQHGVVWLKRKEDAFSWGIVAWQIRRTAPAQSACWRASLRNLAVDAHWTLLDAAVDHALAHVGIAAECAHDVLVQDEGRQR